MKCAKSGFCEKCQKQVIIEKRKHGLLFTWFMCFITCGIWILITPLRSLANYKWYCTQCASRVKPPSPFEGFTKKDNI